MADYAVRYARAFAEVVFDRGLDAATALKDLQTIAAIYEGHEELRKVLSSPAIPAAEKRKLLDALLPMLGVASREMRNFLAVLIDHGRVTALHEVAEHFAGELDRRLGRTRATITSARELTAAERLMLLEQIGRLAAGPVEAAYKIDGELIGGASVRIGSTIYDGSVRGQLARLREQLSGE